MQTEFLRSRWANVAKLFLGLGLGMGAMVAAAVSPSRSHAALDWWAAALIWLVVFSPLVALAWQLWQRHARPQDQAHTIWFGADASEFPKDPR